MRVARFSSPSPYAPTIGFSNAVVHGDLVFLAGLSAANSEGQVVGGDDPYLQARECFRKAESALQRCGSAIDRVLQTRMYLTDAADWREVGRAHGEVFADAKPAATMIVAAALLDARMLVEVEVVAALAD